MPPPPWPIFAAPVKSQGWLNITFPAHFCPRISAILVRDIILIVQYRQKKTRKFSQSLDHSLQRSKSCLSASSAICPEILQDGWRTRGDGLVHLWVDRSWWMFEVVGHRARDREWKITSRSRSLARMCMKQYSLKFFRTHPRMSYRPPSWGAPPPPPSKFLRWDRARCLRNPSDRAQVATPIAPNSSNNTVHRILTRDHLKQNIWLPPYQADDLITGRYRGHLWHQAGLWTKTEPASRLT